MKKIKLTATVMLSISLLLGSLTGCSSTEQSDNKDNIQAEQEIYSDTDVDLSSMSSTMIYAEVSNMCTNPDAYMGKTVKMTGLYTEYEGNGRMYYTCLIPDATACCSQGIEFVLKENPDSYPELGEEITVAGVFGTYMEDGYMYCQLSDATLF